MKKSLDSIVSRFGASAKAKLNNAATTGEPEDQLRSPFEALITDFAELIALPDGDVALVGETMLSDIKTRPDYAITIRNVLVGFVELKAPGKGADPRRFRGHDKDQWERLQSLPNLIYTDGRNWALYRSGEQEQQAKDVSSSCQHFDFNSER